jgi:hypothetical protein
MSVSRVCWLVIKRPTFMRPSFLIFHREGSRQNIVLISMASVQPRHHAKKRTKRTSISDIDAGQPVALPHLGGELLVES